MLYGKYQFFCSLETDAVLPPYKGSTFRGVFGWALKAVVCALRRQECGECLLKERCLYAFVFETPKAAPGRGYARIAAPPHPFVIEPPLSSDRIFPKGSSFDFSLLLFGEANKNLPYFIYAFEQMGNMGFGKRVKGERGRFVLNRVDSCGKTVYSARDQKLRIDRPFDSVELKKPDSYSEDARRVDITLVTPLRLKFQNELRAELPFHVLVRAMLRRVSSLMSFYGEGEPALDYRGLVRQAEANVTTLHSDLKWFDWERYSGRQDQRMLMGGITGSVSYEGELRPYLPLLDFCEAVHLGKQTSFGLGKIQWEAAE